jgi:hypothetical protein
MFNSNVINKKIRCVICKEHKLIMLSTMARSIPKICNDDACRMELKRRKDKERYVKSQKVS